MSNAIPNHIFARFLVASAWKALAQPMTSNDTFVAVTPSNLMHPSSTYVLWTSVHSGSRNGQGRTTFEHMLNAFTETYY